MKKHKKSTLKKILTVAAVAAAGYHAADIAKQAVIKAIPDLPKTDENPNLIHQLLHYLEHPEKQARDGVLVDDAYIVAALTPAKAIIDGRFDCQDFRMQSLLRMQYSHGDTIRAISPTGAQMLEDMFLNAKYWMTEPGDDSMCYWSENHQILYAVAEYMAGQYWYDRPFTNDGALGREHMQRGRERLGYWLEHRLKYGFSEFNSANYYKFNVGPAANFIQFAAPEDADLVQKVRMVLDLLLFDVATNAFRDTFTAPTGRAYTDNMVGITGDGIHALTRYFLKRDEEHLDSTDHMYQNFFLLMAQKDKDGKPLYEIPQVLREIAEDVTPRVIKSSSGLNVSELPRKGYVGQEDDQIMMQLGMESFTNPEVVANTVAYLQNNNMFTNKFVNFFKFLNIKLLNDPRRLEAISRKNPMPNGIAIQRANLYAYRTPDYQLSNVQRYHPGCFGAQQMLNVLNFGGSAVVFTTHPGRELTDKTVRSIPGYWPGFGRSPHGVQHENVLMLLYRIPKIPGFLELYPVPQITHTYLPEAFLDEVKLDGKYAFARQGKAFLALIGHSELAYRPFSQASAIGMRNGLEAYPDKRFDLVQQGNQQFWIYELSHESRESFDEFTVRIKGNRVHYLSKDNMDVGLQDRLSYETGGNTLFTSYGGELAVNLRAQELEHKRFDSDFCTAERESTVFDFAHNGYTLHIDFENGIREYN